MIIEMHGLSVDSVEPYGAALRVQYDINTLWAHPRIIL